MGKSKKEAPFQSRATDEETVAAALDIPASQITYVMLQGLVAGLQHTSSPLRDAAERLLGGKELGSRYCSLIAELRDMLRDEDSQHWTKSATATIDRDDTRWNDALMELRDVLFRMI